MSTRPNVVVIIFDQLRADMLGCYGNTFCQTPNIDSIARRGVVFSRAYCPFPQCSPSRASLITGLLPSKTGIGIQSDYRMLGDLTVERLDPTVLSMGIAFREAGYRTGYIGKWHMSEKEPPHDLKLYGFDFCASEAPRVARPKPFPGARETSEGAMAGLGESTPSWQGAQAKMAAKFVAGNAGKEEPFLLFYSDVRPHPPYHATKEDFDRWAPRDLKLSPNVRDDLAGKPLTHRRLRETIVGREPPGDEYWKEVTRHYCALISAADNDMGLLLRALEESGAMENTIVVCLADHGDTCGAHGFLSKGVVAYEELVRIPMVISWPRRYAGGRTCDRLASIMDVFPTLAEATGIASIAGLDGRSLTPMLEGRPVPEWRKHVVVCHHGNMYGLCTMRAVIGDRYKYVYYPYDLGELYDRQTDPDELHNRIDDPQLAGVVAEMHSVLVREMRQCGDRVHIPNRR